MTAMKTWQVLAIGEGFDRLGIKMSFELSGLINAPDPDNAFSKAVEIAKADFPEIKQANVIGFPRPMINSEEIQEVSSNIETDKIEIHWYAE